MEKSSAVEQTVRSLGPSILITGGSVRHGQMREPEVHARSISEEQSWEDFDDATRKKPKALRGTQLGG